MSTPKERRLGVPQFLAIVLVVIALFLGWDFTRHVLDTMQLAGEEAALDQQLRAAQETNANLQDLQQMVQTDAWIEKYVRTNRHWTRGEEILVVPIATPVPAATPPPTPASLPTPAPKAPWQQLLDFLFQP